MDNTDKFYENSENLSQSQEDVMEGKLEKRDKSEDDEDLENYKTDR
tara:strand:- start:347 stop:484 length:138 start_codon:yes stop_codon:yes gene_type:complete